MWRFYPDPGLFYGFLPKPRFSWDSSFNTSVFLQTDLDAITDSLLPLSEKPDSSYNWIPPPVWIQDTYPVTEPRRTRRTQFGLIDDGSIMEDLAMRFKGKTMTPRSKVKKLQVQPAPNRIIVKNQNKNMQPNAIAVGHIHP